MASQQLLRAGLDPWSRTGKGGVARVDNTLNWGRINMGLTTRAAAAAQRSRRAVCTVVLAAAALSGCIVSDDRCGRNQVEVKEDFPLCACAEGTIPDPRGYGCIKCGEHEEVVNG